MATVKTNPITDEVFENLVSDFRQPLAVTFSESETHALTWGATDQVIDRLLVRQPDLSLQDAFHAITLELKRIDARRTWCEAPDGLNDVEASLVREGKV